jgi:hypothetical protein
LRGAARSTGLEPGQHRWDRTTESWLPD